MGISETETYIFNNWKEQTRLRTISRKKREIIEANDKRIIRLYKEKRELDKRKRELPMIDLNPPIQKGWKRYFVVREDVRRSKQGVFYENLLRKINTTQYSDTKEFKKSTKKCGRRIYEPRKQDLQVIYLYELAKLKITPAELLCFDLKTKVKMINKRIVETYYYEMAEPWRFVLRIRPNLIDKVKAHDNELEQRIDELYAELFRDYANHRRLKKIRDFSYDRWGDTEKEKYSNPLKNKPLQCILEEFM
jgi:hypothetical protein